jgi:hypothetical protein
LIWLSLNWSLGKQKDGEIGTIMGSQTQKQSAQRVGVPSVRQLGVRRSQTYFEKVLSIRTTAGWGLILA